MKRENSLHMGMLAPRAQMQRLSAIALGYAIEANRLQHI
jgi:hypothetical protein